MRLKRTVLYFGAVAALALLSGCGKDVSPQASPAPEYTATRQPAVAASPTSPPVVAAPVVEVIENVSWEPYQVFGATVDQVNRYVTQNGPLTPQGLRVYAATASNLTNAYQAAALSTSCRLLSVTITVSSVIRFPELADAPRIDRATLDRWDAFLENLRRHELGHVALARKGAEDLKTAISGESTYPSCDALKSALDALLRRHVDAVNASNAKYDVETSHGETQGAVFR